MVAPAAAKMCANDGWLLHIGISARSPKKNALALSYAVFTQRIAGLPSFGISLGYAAFNPSSSNLS